MQSILFICPQFFDYHKIIKNKIEENGYQVDWIDDRPKLSIIGKGILRLFPKLLSKKIDKYFSNTIMKHLEAKKYDCVFLVLGQSFSSKHITKIKSKFPKLQLIYYTWDSVDNFPNILELANACDKKYSFDLIDCKKYNFEYLPLFYSKTIQKNFEKKYYATFIGTVKRGKYNYLKTIKEQFDSYASKEHKQNYFYFYLQSKIVFIFYKLFYKEFRHAKLRDFHFKKISYDATLEIQSNSEITIDVTMANQNGFTMRTFETLALYSKLFTTNNNIKESDFYNKNYIYIYDGTLIDFNDSFFNTKYEFNAVFDYSIDNWIDFIFKEI